ncbi:MAG: cytochrome c-type biosis protein CcmE [Myxococcales bacterium]|nr:cytochrome c-type biosis protein CcmE [Myxococcales bacterium]
MHTGMLTKIALTAAVVIVGGGTLIYSSASSAQHYKMVDELVGGGGADALDQWKDKELKVHGWVESGTIVESVVNQEMHRSFVLQKGGKKIRIFNKGPKPDTFKDQSEVVATGRLIPVSDVAQLAADMCKPKSDGKVVANCPIRADGEQTWVVESTELMAKCPSKYDGAASNKIDPKYK